MSGALALVVVLLALAAAGVFSGGSRSPVLTQPTHTTPPATSAAGRETATAKLPTTTLKPGDHGAQVRRLQRALVLLGHAPGKIDGEYGPATRQAVAAFQRTNNLTADGVVGPKTLAALDRSVKNRS